MENGLVDTVGKGVRETMERAVSGRTHACIKRLAGGKLLYNTGTPVWGSVMTGGVGWGEREEGSRGTGVHG